ncbi:MAG: 30S ribosomal protein S4 [Candidatus Kerfeldbacteria bacterium]
MGRNLEPKCKKCRRIGESVCGSAKCAVTRRSYIPGMHGPKYRPRVSEFGMQLREKQKAKYTYGVMERQFRGYYEKANKKAGNTGDILMQLLELRLDNVIYRAGYASTRRQSRQLVSHGHFLVNGRRCDIPSRHMKVGDVIELRTKSQGSEYFEQNKLEMKMHEPPKWLHVDKAANTVKVQALPAVDEVERNIAVNLIVEFYSR